MPACPECGSPYTPPPGHAGRVRCPTCQAVIGSDPASAPAAPAVFSAAFSDEDDRPSRRARRPRPQQRAGVQFLWVSCVAWCLLVAAKHAFMLGRQDSAIQQAALAADSCFWVIVAYVVCRAVDAALHRPHE